MRTHGQCRSAEGCDLLILPLLCFALASDLPPLSHRPNGGVERYRRNGYAPNPSNQQILYTHTPGKKKPAIMLAWIFFGIDQEASAAISASCAISETRAFC
jgi:hypothetical protein